MTSLDAFLAPVMTEVLLAALAKLRMDGPPASLQLGSPWLTNVSLFPGVFAGSFPYLLPGVDAHEVDSLLPFLQSWTNSGGSATLLVQGYEPGNWPSKTSLKYNDSELELLEECLAAGIEVLLGRGFHDKFLMVPGAVVSGSANMTYSGLYRNRERLNLHNADSTTSDHVTAASVCENHIATARRAGQCRPPHNPVGRVDMTSLHEIRRVYGSAWK